MIRAADGTVWKRIDESANDHRVRIETVRQWVNRGKVHSWTLDNKTYVCDDQVADCEREMYFRSRNTPA